MGKKLAVLVVMAAVAAMVGVGSTDTVLKTSVQQYCATAHIPIEWPSSILAFCDKQHFKIEQLTLPVQETSSSAAVFLLIDQSSIGDGTRPNAFSELDVNAQIASPSLRLQLPYFAAHNNETIALSTGQVGDEGWFALTAIPSEWGSAGPTHNGMQNFLHADNNTIGGLGLENTPNVVPLQSEQLKKLEGDTICALVYNGDISVDSNTKVTNLSGATLGLASFKVLTIEAQDRQSSTLPMATITILDANKVCGGQPVLFTETQEIPTNPTPEQPSTVKELPQNASDTREARRNATDFGNVGQNTTQDVVPAGSNSSDTSSERGSDSAANINENNTSTNNGTGDNSTRDSGNTAGEQQTADSGSSNSTSDQGSSQSGSGSNETSSGGEKGSTPSKEPPRRQ